MPVLAFWRFRHSTVQYGGVQCSSHSLRLREGKGSKNAARTLGRVRVRSALHRTAQRTLRILSLRHPTLLAQPLHTGSPVIPVHSVPRAQRRRHIPIFDRYPRPDQTALAFSARASLAGWHIWHTNRGSSGAAAPISPSRRWHSYATHDCYGPPHTLRARVALHFASVSCEVAHVFPQLRPFCRHSPASTLDHIHDLDHPVLSHCIVDFHRPALIGSEL